MKTLRRMYLGGFFALSLAAGCSSSNSSNSPNPDGGSGGGGTGSPSGGTCGPYAACSLLTLADVNQALGTSLTMIAQMDDPPGGLSMGYACEYKSADIHALDLVRFHISCNVPGLRNGPGSYSFDMSAGGVAVTVPKTDAAFWFPANVDAGSHQARIQVYFGGASSFSLTWFPPVSDDVAKAAAVQMAGVILARLP